MKSRRGDGCSRGIEISGGGEVNAKRRIVAHAGPKPVAIAGEDCGNQGLWLSRGCPVVPEFCCVSLATFNASSSRRLAPRFLSFRCEFSRWFIETHEPDRLAAISRSIARGILQLQNCSLARGHVSTGRGNIRGKRSFLRSFVSCVEKTFP